MFFIEYVGSFPIYFVYSHACSDKIRNTPALETLTRNFKDGNACEWKSVKFEPRYLKTPEMMVIKICVNDEVGDPYSCAKFHYSSTMSFCSSAPLLAMCTK